MMKHTKKVNPSKYGGPYIFFYRGEVYADSSNSDSALLPALKNFKYK